MFGCRLSFSVVVVSLIEHLGTLVQVSRQDTVPFAHKTQELNLAICAPCDSCCAPQFRDTEQGRNLFPVQSTGRGGYLSPGQWCRIRGYFKGVSVAVQLLENTVMSNPPTAPWLKTGKIYCFSGNRRCDCSIKPVKFHQKIF